MSSAFKIESGIQLLSRLTKKHNIENFYPVLFKDGPKQSEVIELYSESDINSLLYDLICEALLPICFGRTEFSVLLLNCNANFNFNSLVSFMKQRILIHSKQKDIVVEEGNDMKLNDLLEKMLSHILIADVYDSTQLYTTIHNLESVFLENSNVGLLIVDTVTAFYWTEQCNKIIKMDAYIKNLLQMIQKATKGQKVPIIYTRPEHFSSSKDSIENLEACSELPVLEKVNYRIQIILTNDDCIYQVNVRTYKNFYKKKLYMNQDKIKWM